MGGITSALVKELREKTGAGMMDCKKALTEAAGDMETAVDWLRTKGLSTAAKKSGRAASEGLVGIAVDGARGAVVEVNAETDFVGRNTDFQEFVANVSAMALDIGGDHEKLSAAPYGDLGHSVGEEVTNLVSTIGENISLRRAAALSVTSGVVTGYVHSQAAEGLGKIGVLVALESMGNEAALTALGKQISMHIAAAQPQFLSIADVDPAALDRERAVLTEQAIEAGKPEEIVAKMVEGRLRKYYEEVVLEEQVYVIDNETKISKVLAAAADDAGAPIKLAGFVRFALGEGVEKKEDDFAAEVAKLSGD